MIVDDHPEFRRAARLLLDARGFAVVGEAACARTALAAVTALAPDAVLLDVHLGADCGIDVAHALAREQPTLAVLLMSAQPLNRPEDLRACGARGFVLKSELAHADLRGLHPD